MTRLLLAIRSFFRVLFDREVADRVAAALRAAPVTAEAASTSPRVPAPSAPAASRQKTPPPGRSEALTLLATLQREARFVDFIQEPLGSYSDAQIGAAARDVHRLCGEVIGRAFGLRPVVEAAEGSDVDVPAGAAMRFHLLGNVGAAEPRRGKLCHQGWEATHCQLPQWTGDDAAWLIVAPAEVELR